MRWVFLSVLMVVLGVAVAGFAIYTFGWRDPGSGDERKRALVYAHHVAQVACGDDNSCHAADVTKIGPGIWRVRLAPNDGSGGGSCLAIDVERFTMGVDATKWRGLGRIDC